MSKKELFETYDATGENTDVLYIIKTDRVISCINRLNEYFDESDSNNVAEHYIRENTVRLRFVPRGDDIKPVDEIIAEHNGEVYTLNRKVT